MAEFYDTMNDAHRAMIAKQPIFFVATAAANGRINLSPIGYDVFRVLAPDRVAYLDISGSGNETHAHLAADGRITIMFCNFEQPALILRIYGTGHAVLPQDKKWDSLSGHFDLLPGTRQIFDIAVESVQTSCGWGVPVMQFERERPTLIKSQQNRDPDEWLAKRHQQNRSIDGLTVRTTDRYIGGE